MRWRNTIILAVCITFAAALLITVGMHLDFINTQRQDMKLISNEPLENAPPSLAFATVAMGAFRGLVVDILWMRADKLKEQGQFFDAKQLAEWITTLQPRFATVWEFQAWNMAYNISVAIPANQPDQRWHWVKNGYELLRDQGIPLNPKSILLYRELARIFQHKIGSASDDAHKYYKIQLAMAMESLIGPADNEYFKALAEAPTHWPQIVNDANVAPLIAALKAADKAFADDGKFVSNYLALRQNPARFLPDAFRIIDSFRGTKALKKLDIFAKAYQLRTVWKLDPLLMQQLNKTYGPIDWNDPNTHLPLDWMHPDTHAIYWAVKGLQTAGSEDLSEDGIHADRIVNHSLQNLFRNGKIFIYDLPADQTANLYGPPPKKGMLIKDTTQETTRPKKEIFLRPDLRMFKPYNISALDRIEKYENTKAIQKGSLESLKIGHRNMLKNAIFSFYQAGHSHQAEKMYKQLRQLYPSDDFKVPLVIFVRNRLREELRNIGLNNAKEIVALMLRESYFRYALRDDDEAFGREKMAKEVYQHYKSAYSDEHRIDLPDFKVLRYLALIDFLNDRQYPLNLRLNLRGRIKIERPELAELLEQQEKELLKQSENDE
ncbi:MAG: hypothetical protein JSV82_04525 [Planctomycetota bacterium]|nr:MAG: hypothetical protein JSV82_04525 [Planctomycetota bacterium]